MKNVTAWVEFRVQLNVTDDFDNTDIEEAINEFDYSIKSSSPDVVIEDTEMEGVEISDDGD